MKKRIAVLLLFIPIALFAQESTLPSKAIWDYPIFTSLIGGLIGGVLGVIGTLWTSYYGPKKLIEFKEKRKEEKLNGPRKKLLLSLLNDPEYKEGRRLETLSMVTGTTFEECRRLLVEIGGRGIKHKNNIEGWVLIKNKPIKEE